MTGFSLHSACLGPIGTNAYLLRQGDFSVLIDAPFGTWEWVREVLGPGRRVDALLLTHGHWDHIGDMAAFAVSGVPLYAHADDRPLFETPEIQQSFAPAGMVLKGATPDHWLVDGQSLNLGGLRIKVLHVPGHAPGNIAFYVPAAGLAFPGDVIFSGSVGRYDLPGGDWDVLERSIRTKIYTLPDATRLYPGHGAETTVAEEKRTNPFVTE